MSFLSIAVCTPCRPLQLTVMELEIHGETVIQITEEKVGDTEKKDVSKDINTHLNFIQLTNIYQSL